jgi:iron(III) transport system ATP-binding protein
MSVKLENVVKKFGDTTVLHGLNLEVARGELFTFLGPSGCGKTTALRAIGGFAPPTSGEIYIDGKRMTDVPPEKRNSAMVFQSYALFPHMTVYENIAYGLKVAKLSSADIQAKAMRALGMIRMERHKDKHPSQLSGGQQQRVAFARALVVEPSVLLLDEPLSNLDAIMRIEMRLEIKRLQREVGITTVYITHDQSEAMAISDRIAVMNEGVIEQIGRPEEIYLYPKNEFVARFIGAINIFKGKVSQQGDTPALTTESGLLLRGEAKASHMITAGQDHFACIRPEAIRVAEDAPATDENRIEGRVVEREFLGSHLQLHLSMVNNSKKMIRINLPNSLDNLAIELGQTLTVNLLPRALHFFPCE